VPDSVAKGPEAARLRAEILAARGSADESRSLLEAERDRHPEQVKPWLALARAALQRGDAKEAQQILQQAEKKRGKDANLTLGNIELASRGDPAEARKALAALEPALETFTGDDQTRILRGLAEAYFRVGDFARAVTLWRQVAERAPKDLEVRLRLLEFAFRAGDTATMEEQITAIRGLEGAGGGLTAWGEAARRVVLAEKGDPSQLIEARRRLNEARTRRPRWAPVALLEARIAILEKDIDRAGDQFVQAVKLGERDPAVIRAAVDGLYRRRRYTEARDLLQDCARETLATPDLGRRAAELTLLQSGPEGPGRRQALDQARQAVPANSTNARDYQWLAQIALAAGEPAEAEKQLRKALSLSDTSPDLWLALIQLLAAKDPKGAESAISEGAAKVSKEDAPFVTGPGFEMIGKVEKAREAYDALLASRPDDPAALQVVADFYSRRGPVAKAETCLRRLLEPELKVTDSVRSAARRELALILSGVGSYAKFREALAVLAEGTQPPFREDALTRALVLATRTEKRHEARRILERLAKDAPLPTEAQFVYARLLEADGDRARADDLIVSLLGTDGKNPAIIGWYVQSLLQRGQVQTARPWIDALRGIEPDSLRTVSLAARVAAKDGRTDEASRLLLDFAAKHPDRRMNVALFLEEVGATKEAEKIMREDAKGARPESVLALAEYLSRHKQLDEALRLCADAWKTCPPELVAASSLAIARAGGATPAQLATLAEQLAAASAKQPNSVGLLQARAELAELQNQFDEALSLYKDIIARNANYVPALNNRAWLLALKATPGNEALELIDRVIERAGPVANYLDTRAMAYLAAGRPLPAAADMQEAISQEPAAPYYFHLAEAQLRAGEKAAAVAALREGKKHGLQADTLHALERDRCRKMLAELEIN
jgi:tetratricopeptide (TPR) repeat protein